MQMTSGRGKAGGTSCCRATTTAASAAESAEGRYHVKELADMLVEDEYEPEWVTKGNRVSCKVCDTGSGDLALYVLPIESSGAVYYVCGACAPYVSDAMQQRLRLQRPAPRAPDGGGP